MAKIYGLAQRVIVWLGEEADDSVFAFQELREAAFMADVKSNYSEGFKLSPEDGSKVKRRENAILSLLQRAYFRRVWVLQEIASARHILVTCGKLELHVNTFRIGLKNLDLEFCKNVPLLRLCIRAIISLMESSSLREHLKGELHLDIQPLGELIDMFLSHDATDRRDKVYALLGMCSDHHLMANLQPDYSIGWNELFEKTIRTTIGVHTVTASREHGIACLRTSGYFFGTVVSVGTDGFWSEGQHVEMKFAGPFLPDRTSSPKFIFLFRNGAKAIEKHDLIFLLGDKSRIIVARPMQYYLKIIMVTDVSRVMAFQRQKHYPEISFDKELSIPKGAGLLDLCLTWDWEETMEAPSAKKQESVLSLMRDSTRNSLALEHDHDSDKINALSKLALTLSGCKVNHQACRRLKEMVELCESVYGHQHPFYLGAKEKLEVTAQQKSVQVFMTHDDGLARHLGKVHNPPLQDLAMQFKDRSFRLWLWSRTLIEAVGVYYPDDEFERRAMGDENWWLDYTLKAVRDARVDEALLTTVAISYDPIFTEFLLDFGGSDSYITERVILAAAQNRHFQATKFLALLERSNCEIDDFVSVMHAIRMNHSLWPTKNSMSMEWPASSTGEKRNKVRLTISEEAFIFITEARSTFPEHLRWNTLPALLTAAEDQVSPSQTGKHISVRDYIDEFLKSQRS